VARSCRKNRNGRSISRAMTSVGAEVVPGPTAVAAAPGWYVGPRSPSRHRSAKVGEVSSSFDRSTRVRPMHWSDVA
jgi:hypothetical protein